MRRYILPAIITVVALLMMAYPAAAQVFPILQFTLTTTGTSGAATFINNVLNIPQYSGGGGSGTVTSVTLSTPNSTLSLGGTNPITTSGTIQADLNLAHGNTWIAEQKIITSGTPSFYAENDDTTADSVAIVGYGAESGGIGVFGDTNGGYGIEGESSSGIAGYFDTTSGGTALEALRGNVLLNASSGNTGISSTTPESLLSIGSTNGINFSTATSTFNSTGGINLVNGGCFAIAGTCIGTSGGTGTVTSIIAGTGLSGGTITTSGTIAVNTSQNITTLSNLTTAGFVQSTSGGLLSSAALTSAQVTTALGFTPGTGTVTAIGVTTLDGVSGTSSGGATPNLTISLGAITPTTVNALTLGRGFGSISNNIAVGANVLNSSSLTGGHNTGVGESSLDSITSGVDNTGIGENAGAFITTGNYNSALGESALFNDSTGSFNTAVGTFSLYNVAGASNVGLGYFAGYRYTGSNALFVNNIQESSSANDQAFSLLYGTFSGSAGSLTGQMLDVNGNLGVASTSPLYQLSVGTAGSLYGTIFNTEHALATTTTMTVDWKSGNQQLIKIGTSATTISFTNAYPGGNIRLIVCNPASGTAGAITWSGVDWSGGTVPTQTTTTNVCDIWSFISTAATSTTKIFGAMNANYP